MQAAMYPLFLMPTIQSDVDGSYVGIDRQVAHGARLPLRVGAVALGHVSDAHAAARSRRIRPARSTPFSRSSRCRRASGFFPKWPIGDGEAGHDDRRERRGRDRRRLREGHARASTPRARTRRCSAAAMSTTAPAGGRGGRDQVVPYMQLGYVPAQAMAASSAASLTIEYGQDDAALAQLATALGHTADAATLQLAPARLAEALRPCDRPALGEERGRGRGRPRTAPGTEFTEDFDEANAQQSVWGPWYDMPTTADRAWAARPRSSRSSETFFENGKADYDAIEWIDAAVGRRHPQVLLGRQRAGHPLAVPVRALGPARSHAEVDPVDRVRGLHGGRRRRCPATTTPAR